MPDGNTRSPGAILDITLSTIGPEVPGETMLPDVLVPAAFLGAPCAMAQAQQPQGGRVPAIPPLPPPVAMDRLQRAAQALREAVCGEVGMRPSARTTNQVTKAASGAAMSRAAGDQGHPTSHAGRIQTASGAPHPMSVTYLLGLGELSDPAALSWLCIGTRLGLRPPPTMPGRRCDRHRIEVCAPDGCRLGRLPAEDARLVEELIDSGVAAWARVVALVPCLGRSRVHLEIEVGGDGGL